MCAITIPITQEFGNVLWGGNVTCGDITKINLGIVVKARLKSGQNQKLRVLPFRPLQQGVPPSNGASASRCVSCPVQFCVTESTLEQFLVCFCDSDIELPMTIVMKQAGGSDDQ
jgi:hypothetical protein